MTVFSLIELFRSWVRYLLIHIINFKQYNYRILIHIKILMIFFLKLRINII